MRYSLDARTSRRPLWVLSGLVIASMIPSNAHAALPPWGQRTAELHAVLDAGALALAGTGEVIASVSYQGPHYLIATEYCTVVVNLVAAEPLAAEDTVSVPGPRPFSARAERPACD